MNLHLREVIEVIGVCDCGGSVRQIQVKKTAAVAALPQGLMSLKLPCNTAASVNAEPLGHLSIHNAPDGFIHQGQLLQTEVALLSSGLYGIRRSPSASEFHRIGPGQKPGFAGCTAGRDFHPAPKKPSGGFIRPRAF